MVSPTPPPAAPAVSLTDLFKKVEAPEELITFFVTTSKLASVDLFLDYVVKDKYEVELKEIITEAFPVADSAEGRTLVDQRLLVSKARGAYRLAMEYKESEKQNRDKSEALKTDADMEKDIGETEKKRLKETWNKTHDWLPDPSVRAAPHLRNRVFREFHAEAMTLHAVEKAVTLEDAKAPAEKVEVPISEASDARMSFQFVKPQRKQITTPLAYIAALRVITGIYAFCGSHKAASKRHPGRTVRFFPFGVGLAYCDQLMTKITKIRLKEEDKLYWLRIRDEATRSGMVRMVNDGWPAGEALEKAYEDEASFWRMKDDNVVAAPMEDDEKTRGSHSGKRTRSRNPKSAINAKLPAQVTIDKNKVKWCGAYNSPKGCTRREKDCPQRGRHGCNIQVAKGWACGDRNHSALDH